MKALEILKDIEESKWCGVKPTLSNYNLEDIKKAIKELEELETKDRLAELEKVILDYYLAKGYRIGVGGWAFRVEIISFHKYKRIVVYFKEHHLVNSSFAFSTINETTKEMFDKAFEYFSTKDTNVK